MITKQDLERVLNKKKSQETRRIKQLIQQFISRLEAAVKRGRVFIPNIGNDPRVHEGIKKACAAEGISVEITEAKFKGKRKDRLRDCVVHNAKVSLKDE